jgi:hypothetical protein
VSVRVRAGSAAIWDVAVDATRVFWCEGMELASASRVGGAKTTLMSGQYAGYFAVQGGYLNFGNNAGYWADGTGVFRVPLGGGAVEPLATKRVGVCGLATDGTNVFFAECGNTDLGYVARVPASGGAAVQVTGLVRKPGSIAMDADAVFWNDGASIRRLPR